MRIKGDEIARKKKYKRDLEMAREEDEPVLFPEAHPPFEEEVEMTRTIASSVWAPWELLASVDA
jgi:hypothetical protein